MLQELGARLGGLEQNNQQPLQLVEKATQRPPVLKAIPGQKGGYGSPISIGLDITNPGGLSITLSAFATQPGALVAIQDNRLTITPPARYAGTFSVTVTAGNGFAIVAQSFHVTVTEPPAPVIKPIWRVGTFTFTVTASNGYAKASQSVRVTVTPPWPAISAAVAAILILCGGGARLMKSLLLSNGASASEPERAAQQPAAPQRGTTATSPGAATSSSTPLAPPAAPQTFIRPEDAGSWIGKECTVEMTVRSTRDLGWAVAPNSGDRHTDDKNLSIAIARKIRGRGSAIWGLPTSNATSVAVLSSR